jgi:hypothetical protein
MRYQLRYVRLPHVPEGLRGPATVSELRVRSQTVRASNTFEARLAKSPPAQSRMAAQPLAGPGPFLPNGQK